jgi:hypothetical protein
MSSRRFAELSDTPAPVAVRLAGEAPSSTPPRQAVLLLGGVQPEILILIFLRDGTGATERDVKAPGRTERRRSEGTGTKSRPSLSQMVWLLCRMYGPDTWLTGVRGHGGHIMPRYQALFMSMVRTR